MELTEHTEKTFERNTCDERFDVKANVYITEKKHHVESVQTCRNNPCKYDSKSCWFNHDTNGNDNKINGNENNENNGNENNEDIIEKIFKVMKKLN